MYLHSWQRFTEDLKDLRVEMNIPDFLADCGTKKAYLGSEICLGCLGITLFRNCLGIVWHAP